MIQFESVSKKYQNRGGDPVCALNSVDLSINKGDFVTVLGASGSGKSTLLFTIGGMLSPTSGIVRYNGDDIYSNSHEYRAAIRRTRIGFVFQTFNLVPYLSCLENVALPAILNGRKKNEAMELAADMLKTIGLGQRLKHNPSKLSVGERQRAAILRSLINDPEVILADEPTGNLDPDNSAGVIDIFRNLNEKGRTIVMVTHNHELIRHGNRTIRLNNGFIDKEESITGGEDKTR